MLCIFIGCYTPYLYKMLPYPGLAAEYHPYTAYHVFETLQILLFTGLGFFLLLKKLVPDPTISLDMDWFYRKGGRAFLWLARKPVQAADTFVGELYRLAGLVPLMMSARVAGLFDNEVIDGAGGWLGRNHPGHRAPAPLRPTRPDAAEPGLRLRGGRRSDHRLPPVFQFSALAK